MKTQLSKFAFAIVAIALMAQLFMAGRAVAQTSPASQTYLKDTTISKAVYKMYVGPKGGKYVIRISKAGKEYKVYFK